MTRRAELLALAERVEKGETARKLTVEIYRAAGFTVRQWNSATNWQLRSADEWLQMPDLTLSIDAQTALPARIVKVWTTPDGMGAEAASGSVISECASAPTERSARLAALLRAMAEDGE